LILLTCPTRLSLTPQTARGLSLVATTEGAVLRLLLLLLAQLDAPRLLDVLHRRLQVRDAVVALPVQLLLSSWTVHVVGPQCFVLLPVLDRLADALSSRGFVAHRRYDGGVLGPPAAHRRVEVTLREHASVTGHQVCGPVKGGTLVFRDGGGVQRRESGVFLDLFAAEGLLPRRVALAATHLPRSVGMPRRHAPAPAALEIPPSEGRGDDLGLPDSQVSPAVV